MSTRHTMNNNKAQALVEFVLLLPIILILMFTAIDIAHLALEKNELNNELSDQIKLINDKKKTVSEVENELKEDYNVTVNNDSNYLTIEVKKEVKWISPLTKLVVNNYTLTSKRVISIE